MYYKTFKGMRISALGFGGLRLPCSTGRPGRIDRVKGREVLAAALARGINYFDTAFTYQNGDSELFLGEALSQYPRDSYYLATKFYAGTGSGIEAVFEEQLRRCKTGYFDFYLLHGMDENNIAAYTDKGKNYPGYLLRQQEAGRIRNIGFSSHAAPETLEKFLDCYSGFDMALIQLNYVDWTLLDAKRQYELLTTRRIPVWVMEPMKGGRLSTLNDKAAALLKSAAPGRSLSSWGFRWLMGLDNVQTVLSGMSTVEQVLDNAETFARRDPLDHAEAQVLEQAKAAFMDELGVPCSACRYCCEVCPAELDIPLLIQAYNERNISGETWRLAALANATSPSACTQCGACRERCPQHIDVPAIMRELA